MQKLPPTLLTTVTPYYAVLTISVNSLSTTQKPMMKILPVKLIWMALLLCYIPLSDGKNSPPFPSAVPPIHHIPQTASIPVTANACILSPLHKTFDDLLCSKNIPEVSLSMSHHFELSCSTPLPNIVTNFLLKFGPIHGTFSLTTYGIWYSKATSMHPHYPSPLQRFQSPVSPSARTRTRT